MSSYKEVTLQTRQNIMDAFWELYCEKRIEKITVREITTKAGYNRSTFYEYFKDVYHVLETIEESLLPGLDEIPELLTAEGFDDSPVDAFIKLYAKSSKYYSVLLGDKGDPAFAGKMKDGMKAKLLEHLEDTQSENPAFDYSLEYMLSGMIGILSYWFHRGEDMPKAELVQLISSNIASKKVQTLYKTHKKSYEN